MESWSWLVSGMDTLNGCLKFRVCRAVTWQRVNRRHSEERVSLLAPAACRTGASMYKYQRILSSNCESEQKKKKNGR